MKKDGLYSSGIFAKMAHVTKKTLRYYDEHNILKPSVVLENGTRLYSDNDFAKLQQIIFLKYLSFPLEDIKELTVRNADRDFWLESLNMQTNLLDEHIGQMTLMKNSLQEARAAIAEGREVNWSDMLLLANSNEMEQKLKTQYLTSSNLSARIHLHSCYSENIEGWFPWLFRMAGLKQGEYVLELGCGDGSFWLENMDRLPEGLSVILSDISAGIVRETEKKWMLQRALKQDEDTKENAKDMLIENRIREEGLKSEHDVREGLQDIFPETGAKHEKQKCSRVDFRVMDAQYIAAEDDSQDVVIANHMLFYCENIPKVLAEVRRVLKPGGRFICSTYSAEHMQEISGMVKAFDDRIVLSADVLFERFGKDNGTSLLEPYFSAISWLQYEDCLRVTKPEPLIAYVLSCHGNQNRYIVDKYHDFCAFVKKKTEHGMYITKDAGVFICIKNC